MVNRIIKGNFLFRSKVKDIYTNVSYILPALCNLSFFQAHMAKRSFVQMKDSCLTYLNSGEKYKTINDRNFAVIYVSFYDDYSWLTYFSAVQVHDLSYNIINLHLHHLWACYVLTT